MTTVPHNLRRTRALQRIVFWSFRLATYFVLACATYIFLDIGIKGGRTVFTRHAPFINVPLFIPTLSKALLSAAHQATMPEGTVLQIDDVFTVKVAVALLVVPYRLVTVTMLAVTVVT